MPLLLASAPCCHAQTRLGYPCRSSIVRGKKRCRMHGGAMGSGHRDKLNLTIMCRTQVKTLPDVVPEVAYRMPRQLERTWAT
ncbi:HGGxSTG domain-containing protein [Sphingomonas montana]|uniref:HGGxSTG domain-containing protein n=1 Tax=Sphingomonas montana TaxID=1843236 RepID=UPI003B82F94D